MIRLLPLIATLTGCSVVLIDEPCDTAIPPQGDSGDTGIPPADRFIDVGTGAIHTCGISEVGTILCWGANDDDQLNAPMGTFVSISVGHAHSCALSNDGNVECWGRNDDGQTSLIGTFSDVAAGGAHTCGLEEDGSVTCVGKNDQGQLRAPDSTFIDLVAGANHTCGTVVKDSGDYGSECWGSIEKSTEPEENHRQLIAGNEWTCAEHHAKDGTVSYPCFGDNEYGQHDIVSDLMVGTLAAGSRHGCGLTETNEVVCWGSNDASQLTAPAGTFSRIVSGPTSLHTCAMEMSESDENDASPITCWGLDAENQLTP